MIGLLVFQKPLSQFEYGFVGKIYDFIMRHVVLGAADLLRKFDTHVVDFAVLGVGRTTQAFSRILRTSMSGNVQHYGLIMAIGVLVLLTLAMIVL